MLEQPKPYNLEKAQEEAGKMKKKVEKKEAKSYEGVKEFIDKRDKEKEKIE